MSYSDTTKITIMTLLTLSSLTCGHPRSKDYRGAAEVVATKNGITSEPSCEELKAMWRFSKRQSRAAEITNEIPMYRDPFISNVWESYYPASRSIGGQRINKYRTRPIYGVLVHNPPYFRMHEKMDKNKAYAGVARWYQTPIKSEPSRKIAALRMSGGSGGSSPGGGTAPGGRRGMGLETGPASGGGSSSPISSIGFPPQQGSFQHLKELIKTERARELQQQRASEEAAARAAALKDLSREHQRNRGGFYDRYDYGTEEDDYTPSSSSIYTGSSHRPAGIVSYPDILAPAARPIGHLVRFIPEYEHSRQLGRFKPHRPTLFETSFNTGYSGYIP